MLAGTAKLEITPKTNVWMDGMIRSHKSVGVHDPLFVRALVLAPGNDPAEAFAVVSADICGLNEDDSRAVREAAAEATGIPVGHIIIATTHTHSGPATMGVFNQYEAQYVSDTVRPAIVSALTQAAENRRPVAAGCESGREETVSHYRRLLADDGHVVMNWEPYPAENIVRPLGEPDPEVGVLRIGDVADPSKTICTLFNHAGHPNVMSGENYLISADYPGFAEKCLEDEFGGTAMFVNGAQGSVDIDGLKDRDWEGVERAGGALAGAVVETVGSISLSDAAFVRGAAPNST